MAKLVLKARLIKQEAKLKGVAKKTIYKGGNKKNKKNVMYMLCLKQKRKLLTCYAWKERFKGKSNLPCFKLERVLDLEWSP